MKAIDVRVPSAAELRAFERVFMQSFQQPAENARLFARRYGRSSFRVARRDGAVAGGLAIIRMGQWFGGRSVPMAGIAGVVVLPEHRAAGVGSRLMRSALEEIGEPLSALFPATQPVYRRVGYEHAGTYVAYALPTRTIDARERTLEVRPVRTSDESAVRRLYDEFARRTSGLLDRPRPLWERVRRMIRDPVYGYLVLRGARAEGYVYYSQEPRQPFGYDLLVRDLVALTPEAGRRLLTLFADHRSVTENVKFAAGPSVPWLALPAEHEVKVTRFLRWMVRIVDVKRALEARGYAGGVEVEAHLDVRDDVLPRNSGRFVLEVAAGRARVRKGGRGAVRIDVRGLASVYTGYLSPMELRGTGYVDAADRELERLTPAFAGPAPWMPEIF